jgi:hypothetical protein
MEPQVVLILTLLECTNLDRLADVLALRDGEREALVSVETSS